jgi:hypothetical protein
MTGLVISNRAIDKYFKFLKKLDNNSKKRLIIKLTESIDSKNFEAFEPRSIYGKWEDSRDSDEIIKSIKDSRSENKEIEKFE